MVYNPNEGSKKTGIDLNYLATKAPRESKENLFQDLNPKSFSALLGDLESWWQRVFVLAIDPSIFSAQRYRQQAGSSERRSRTCLCTELKRLLRSP